MGSRDTVRKPKDQQRHTWVLASIGEEAETKKKGKLYLPVLGRKKAGRLSQTSWWLLRAVLGGQEFGEGKGQ